MDSYDYEHMGGREQHTRELTENSELVAQLRARITELEMSDAVLRFAAECAAMRATNHAEGILIAFAAGKFSRTAAAVSAACEEARAFGHDSAEFHTRADDLHARLLRMPRSNS